MQALRLVLEDGKGVGSVARDLDPTETALREWLNVLARIARMARRGSRLPSARSLARLRNENQRARTEQELLIGRDPFAKQQA